MISSVPPSYAYPYAPSFRPSAPSPLALPAVPALSSPINTPHRLYNYIGPFQATTLFLTGVASSVALKWLLKGATLPKLLDPAKPKPPAGANPLDDLTKDAKSEYQTAVYFTEGLASVLMFAIRNPGPVQQRLKGYLGATALGYVLGSMADGVQEIWVRREETQIRATLLNQMANHFRQSIRYKAQLDQQLAERTKARILQILRQHNVPFPETLLKPTPDVLHNKLYRYPYEPYHFSNPLPSPNDTSPYRFGTTTSEPASPPLPTPEPWHLTLMKAAIVGAGFACGTLGQLMLGFMGRASRLAAVDQIPETAKKTFYKIFNVSNIEALFLTGNGRLLLTVLGLTAAARLGKMLVDGYREIEVTRHNASTELRYQMYNWLSLDPAFHRIAEEEALDESLRKLQDALPVEAYNRKALETRIQTILSNIGRNSAPKYFQMTPAVNLVAARS